MSELKRTPLNAVHRELGARMVDFGGWDMPLQYEGILAEHHAVRGRVGLFDVSHMGEIRIRGAQARDLVQFLTPNDVDRLQVGQIHYTAFLTEAGTFVDDLLCHKLSDREFLLVVNAGNTPKDVDWVRSHAGGFDCEVLDESPDTGQVALQGRDSLAVLQPLVDLDLAAMRYYWFAPGHFRGLPVLIARTGYTGEDGFEVYCPAGETEGVWRALMASGKPLGLVPTGLGCRNTLRLEAKMALYGHEIDDTTHALEADLAWIVKFAKGDFIGRDALVRAKAEGLRRKLVGFRMQEKRDIARDGMAVLVDGAEAGRVTSAAPSATMGCNLGLAYVPIDRAGVGSALAIGIRGRECPAEVVPTPFYKRPA